MCLACCSARCNARCRPRSMSCEVIAGCTEAESRRSDAARHIALVCRLPAKQLLLEKGVKAWALNNERLEPDGPRVFGQSEG